MRVSQDVEMPPGENWEARLLEYTASLDSYRSRTSKNLNEPPPDDQVAEIERVLLSKIRIDESAADQEIQALEARLQELQTRKSAFSSLVRSCRRLVVPTGRFPPDVLLEIYKHYFQNETGDRPYRLFTMTEGPWVFSHVCRHWRQIMLSFPALWANFIIEFLAPKHPDHAIFYVDLALARSQSHPLDFEFEVNRSVAPLPSTFQRGWSGIALQIMPTVSRWRRVTLELGKSDLQMISRMRAASGSPAGYLAHLEKLNVRLTSETTTDASLWEAFSDAPRLRDVAMQPVRGAFLKVPFHQLERLAITSIYGELETDADRLQTEVKLIQLCPSLKHFDASFYKWDQDVEVDLRVDEMIRHNTITSLTISDTALLSSFYFPALEDLSIRPAKYSLTNVRASHDLLRFLRRTRTKLRSLHVVNLDCSTTSFDDFSLVMMEHGQSLKVLHIHYNDTATFPPDEAWRFLDFHHCLLRRLVVDSIQITVLPALEKLYYTCGSTAIGIDALRMLILPVVESRWVSPPVDVARLMSLKYTTKNVDDILCAPEDVREKFAQFRSEGLELEISAAASFPRPGVPTKTTNIQFERKCWVYDLL